MCSIATPSPTAAAAGTPESFFVIRCLIRFVCLFDVDDASSDGVGWTFLVMSTHVVKSPIPLSARLVKIIRLN